MVKGSSRDTIGILEWEEIYNKAEAIFEKIISKSFPKLVKKTQVNYFNIGKKLLMQFHILKKEENDMIILIVV